MEEKLFIDEYRIGFIFNYPDPFVDDDLKACLENRGFETVKGDRVIVAPPFRAHRADIAKKGDIVVLYDNETSFVGIAGNKVEEVITNFAVLQEILKEVDINYSEKIKSAELVVNARVRTKENPSDVIHRFSRTDKLTPFRQIFGDDIRVFTLRIAPKDIIDVKNDNWFDVRIEPLFRNPLYYFVGIVYRNKDFSRVMSIGNNIEKIVLSVVDVVERE